MKNKIWLRIILFTLLVSTLLSLFSCAKKEEVEDTDGENVVTTNVVDNEVDYNPYIEAKDYGGREFVIFSMDMTGSPDYEEFGVDTYTSHTINSAVYERNMYLEDKYNIDITVNYEAKTSMASTVYRLHTSQAVNFDVINATLDHIINMARNGCLMQIKDIPHINTDKPYWNSKIIDSGTIGNRSYLISGDANIWALHSTAAVMFNSNMIAEKKIANPYELVANNEWTFENFKKMSAQAAAELNGDGKYDENDCYGCVSTYAAVETMFTGMGGVLVSKDANDQMVMNYKSARNNDIIMNIIGYWKNVQEALLINRWPAYTSPKNMNMMADVFNDGHALFVTELLYQLPTLVENNFTVGIVPAPKFDADQENYASFVHIAHATGLGIPLLCEDSDMVGRVLEDMAWESMSTVRYAYYDVNLKSRRAQDNESSEMLDIIYANTYVDAGLLYGGAGLQIGQTIRGLVYNSATDISSSIEIAYNHDKAVIDELLEKYFQT